MRTAGSRLGAGWAEAPPLRPSFRPSLLLLFALPHKLDPDMASFFRSSTALLRQAPRPAGLLRSFASPPPAVKVPIALISQLRFVQTPLYSPLRLPTSSSEPHRGKRADRTRRNVFLA